MLMPAPVSPRTLPDAPWKGRLDAFERFMINSQVRSERNGYVLEGCVMEREAMFLADHPDV